jgi:transglutaminase-like putative cysteine protease
MIRTRRELITWGPFAVLVALIGSGLAFTGEAERPVGFTERVRLGALGSLRVDETIVAEIEGVTTPYLRGRTLSRYHDGTWWPTDASPASVVPDEGAHEHFFRLRRRDDAIFLPLGARLALPSEGSAQMRRDGTFIVDPSVRELAFRLETEASEADPGDLQLPRGLRAALASRAARLAGSGPPRVQAERLRRALSEAKGYRLDFEPRPSVDPVLDFLDRAEGGHCELFASAYVLLARSLGIPARLVSGYYASERDPVRKTARARRSDAHAWAEVHVDGRYRTVDPTPAQRSKITSM